jgi:hypothetical protein
MVLQVATSAAGSEDWRSRSPQRPMPARVVRKKARLLWRVSSEA